MATSKKTGDKKASKSFTQTLTPTKDTGGTNVFGNSDDDALVRSLYIKKGSPVEGASEIKITVEVVA